MRKLIEFGLSLDVLLDQYERINIWLIKPCDNDTVQMGIHIPTFRKNLPPSFSRNPGRVTWMETACSPEMFIIVHTNLVGVMSKGLECSSTLLLEPQILNTEFRCGNKMPTRCNRGFYYRSYCLLNMFRASLCPSSGAQEYYTVVAACGISCCGFSSSWSGVELRVVCPVCRMLVWNWTPSNQVHNKQRSVHFHCPIVDSRVRDDDPDGVATTSISISGAFNNGSPFVRHNG